MPQPSSFWSRGAWLAAGRLDESFRYTMDHEYWGRLARSGYYPLCLVEALAVFRRHEESKTSEGYIPFLREETHVIDKSLPKPPCRRKMFFSTAANFSWTKSIILSGAVYSYTCPLNLTSTFTPYELNFSVDFQFIQKSFLSDSASLSKTMLGRGERSILTRSRIR